MRRRNSFLKRRLKALIARRISAADGPGYLYAFFDGRNVVKVGRAVDVRRRELQWDVACWNPNRVWKDSIWCPYVHCTGKFRLWVRQSLLTGDRIYRAHPIGARLCRPTKTQMSYVYVNSLSVCFLLMYCRWQAPSGKISIPRHPERDLNSRSKRSSYGSFFIEPCIVK